MKSDYTNYLKLNSGFFTIGTCASIYSYTTQSVKYPASVVLKESVKIGLKSSVLGSAVLLSTMASVEAFLDLVE
jgi:hypothetical protein